jgi:hypothetical protein
MPEGEGFSASMWTEDIVMDADSVKRGRDGHLSFQRHF